VPIRYEASGAVVIITIDRPEAMNALDPAHNEALTGAFERFEREDSARVAVLTGAGNAAFSAGADLRRLIPPFHDAVRAGGSPPWALGGITDKAINKPTIAAVNGHALAGGLELALACDIRIASVNATFGLAETKWGLIPGAGGTQRLPRAVPLGPAMEMILTGEPIDAGQALRWGLVNRVLPSDRLLPEADRNGLDRGRQGTAGGAGSSRGRPRGARLHAGRRPRARAENFSRHHADRRRR
jgi:enoyl-CoA hydratase/carnithine racemase